MPAEKNKIRARVLRSGAWGPSGSAPEAPMATRAGMAGGPRSPGNGRGSSVEYTLKGSGWFGQSRKWALVRRLSEECLVPLWEGHGAAARRVSITTLLNVHA